MWSVPTLVAWLKREAPNDLLMPSEYAILMRTLCALDADTHESAEAYEAEYPDPSNPRVLAA